MVLNTFIAEPIRTITNDSIKTTLAYVFYTDSLTNFFKEKKPSNHNHTIFLLSFRNTLSTFYSQVKDNIPISI